MGLPDEQIALPSEFSHRGPVTVNRTEHHLAALFHGVGVITTGDLKTGGETLDIPFEPSGMGLIEVVQVETSCRSGEANTPKLLRWASPHSWVVKSVRGLRARSSAMIRAAPR